MRFDTVAPTVRRIVTNVRTKGDRALFKYAAKFDGLKDTVNLRITPEEMAAAWEAISSPLRDALSTRPIRFEHLLSISFQLHGANRPSLD